jgi:hypothetical protein
MPLITPPVTKMYFILEKRRRDWNEIKRSPKPKIKNGQEKDKTKNRLCARTRGASPVRTSSFPRKLKKGDVWYNIPQNEQMRLWKIRPKCIPTHVWPKLLNKLLPWEKKLRLLLSFTKKFIANNGPIWEKNHPIWSPWFDIKKGGGAAW